MSNTVICVVYGDNCLFWARSQYEIDNLMKSFKEIGHSYNWEHSKGEQVSDFLDIDTKTLDGGGFNFCQIGLICKILESTGMEHCDGFQKLTKVEAPIGIDKYGFKDNRDCTNSYDYVIGMIFYLESNIRPYIYFAVHRCDWFKHNTKAPH